MWILVIALFGALILANIANKSLTKERDFYKKKAIEIHRRRGGGFNRSHKVERALEREFMTKG
jgi:hypothetical protein